MRANRWALGLGACLAGCGQPPAPTGAPLVASPAGVPSRPAASAASSSTAPAASAEPLAPPSAPRWTTLPNSDTCMELGPRAYTDFSTFPSKVECEAWVARRSCRPGFSCFDGCNWRSCDDRGAGIDQTLAACSSGIVRFLFERGTTKDKLATDWAWLVDMIAMRIKAPERKLRVRGYAAPDEAKDAAGVARLAKARADTVARDLVKHGVSRQRLVIDVGADSDLPSHDPERALVVLSVLPEHPVRDDFEPNSNEYRSFCGAQPR